MGNIITTDKFTEEESVFLLEKLLQAVSNVTGIEKEILTEKRSSNYLNEPRGVLYVIAHNEGIKERITADFMKRGRSTITTVRATYCGYVEVEKTTRKLYKQVCEEFKRLCGY